MADIDRRVQKTRQLLQEALIGLILEQDYNSVTVRDILERANVGRSTFYSHFLDKDDLLQSCLDSFARLFEQHSRITAAQQGIGDSSLTFSAFQFVQRNYRLFKALLRNQRSNKLSGLVYDCVLAQVRQDVTAQRIRQKYSPQQAELVARYFVNAFMGVLGWWIETEMACTIEEITALFKQLTLPAVNSILGSETTQIIPGID